MKTPAPHLVLLPLHSPAPHLHLSVAGDSLEPVGLDFVSSLSLPLKAGCVSSGPWAASGMRFLAVLSNKNWKELSLGFESWLCPLAVVWLFIHHNFSETQSLHLPQDTCSPGTQRALEGMREGACVPVLGTMPSTQHMSPPPS